MPFEKQNAQRALYCSVCWRVSPYVYRSEPCEDAVIEIKLSCFTYARSHKEIVEHGVAKRFYGGFIITEEGMGFFTCAYFKKVGG